MLPLREAPPGVRLRHAGQCQGHAQHLSDTAVPPAPGFTGASPVYSDVCATLLEETALRSIPSTPPADPTCPGRGGILGKFIKTMILKPRKYTARMNFHTRSPLLSRLHVAQPREVADRCYGPPWRNRSRGRFLQVHAAGRGQSWAGRPGAGPGEEDVGARPDRAARWAAQAPQAPAGSPGEDVHSPPS